MHTTGHQQQQDKDERNESTGSSAIEHLQMQSFIAANKLDISYYENLYKDFHLHPELSGLEKETASRIEKQLSKLDVPRIHTGIGGHGIAGVFDNGSGPTILLRADFDALPVKEKTGLPYASTVRQKDTDGEEKPVAHVCGHDFHTTCLLAAAEILIRRKDVWTGTLILLFQPSEETLSGARTMIEDGLYDKIPLPDYLLGQHCIFDRAGSVALQPEAFLASSDSMKITFHGRGSHSSQPQMSIDPVIMACHAAIRLQSIISREVHPFDAAVVTVSAIHGGSAQNVIPGDAYMLVNIRTFGETVRKQVLAAIERIVNAEAQASGASKEPDIAYTNRCPSLVNDKTASDKLRGTFADLFGRQFNPGRGRIMGTEDFCELATAINKPSVYWVFGGTDQGKYDDAERRGKIMEEIPFQHSPFFGPVLQPTLTTGINAMLAAALTFLDKR